MIVSLLGLVISLFAYLLAFPRPEQRRFDVYAALLSLHIFTTVAYWLLSFESGMDAFMYYRDPFGFYNLNAFKSGTYFVVHIVQFIRNTLGGSFLDHFLFFQCFGMIAAALMMRCFNEVAESLGTLVPLPVYIILFLPGFHFWTCGIGKDAPMIMAIVLATWASLHIQKRILWMVVALVIMALIRPHIAAIVMVASAGALFLSGQLDKRVRIALAPIVLIGLVFVAARASDRLGVSLDTQSVSDFVDTQQGMGKRFGSGADLSALPLPLKIWSLLFRPFFYDAEGMMQWTASVENAVWLYFFGYLAYNWRILLRLVKSMYYVTYCIIFAGVLILLLSLVNYNVGLGQRQKMMVLPAILLLYATVFLYKRYLSRERTYGGAQEVASPAVQAAPAGA